tara:strand:- start:24076 stop:25320 length:1245 start_codon:yes stop_codon:yes gene_type:complete
VWKKVLEYNMMNASTNDAKFSNIELNNKTRDLFYITYTSKNGNKYKNVSVPLLKYNADNLTYSLNIDANNYLNDSEFWSGGNGSGYNNRRKGLNRVITRFSSKSVNIPRNAQYPIPKQITTLNYYYAISNSPLYYGDLDGDEELTGKDVLLLARLAKGLDNIDDYSDINSIDGVDRRVLAYVADQPLAYDPAFDPPNDLDVEALMRYVVKEENYTSLPVYSAVPSTPTMTGTITPSTETPSSIGIETTLDIGNNWQLKTKGTGELQFVNIDDVGNLSVMAQIIPNETGTKLTETDFPHNVKINISENWQIWYPGLSEETLPNDDPAKQLKFLYNNISQTLIIPYVGTSNGLENLINNNYAFGELWQMVGEANKLKFYFRENTYSGTKYYPQVVIGTPNASMQKYIAMAKKIRLI